MIIKELPSGPLMVNTYLAYDEINKKGFIVDPGGYDKKMMDTIAEEGLEIGYIILTHGHFDHIGGVNRYKEEFPDVKVLCAEAEVPMLADASMNMSTMYGQPTVITPDVTVKENDTLKIGDMEMKFVMTPGHSPGGMCVIMDGVVFAGDTLFQQSIGRTDFPGGSYDVLIDSIRKKLLTLPDDTKVLPGHMGPTTVGFEKRYNPFVS